MILRYRGNSRAGSQRSSRPFLGRAQVLLVLFALVFVAYGCTKTSAPGAEVDGFSVEDDGFATQTMAELRTVADYERLATVGDSGQAIVKFTVQDFKNEPEIVWYDTNFYELHDEWYWFRLLNGHPISGIRQQPETGLKFDSIDAAYAWAQARTDSQLELPLGLRFSGDGRLYSDEAYLVAGVGGPADLANELAAEGFSERSLGFGSLLRFEPDPTDETSEAQWLLQFEYSDPLPVEDLEVFFEQVKSTVPNNVAEQLRWVARSPEQIALAEELVALDHELAAAYVQLSDLVTPGEVQVYNPGITAGRIVKVGPGADKDYVDTRPGDIVLAESVPDFLPAGSGLLTGVPQTPLAHVNLLARNRGIPNLYYGGLFSNLELNSFAAVEALAIISAEDNEIAVSAISNEDYARWVGLQQPNPVSLPSTNLAPNDDVVSLGAIVQGIGARHLDETELAELRLSIGGKATGMVALIESDVETPHKPMAVNIRAFEEHQRQFMADIEATTSANGFEFDKRVRLLLLEGTVRYDFAYGQPVDQQFKQEFLTENADGPLKDVLEADGLKALIRSRDLNTETYDRILLALEKNFSELSDLQGLRFRSSSNVEDIAGFNGAGLYESNTGFLNPQRQQNPKDHKKSIEWAIKKTWASYWNIEAYDERQLEQIDHTSGAMAVLVHPRFDDPAEVNNGVFTFAIQNAGLASEAHEMEVNVQLGAESVANPDAALGALPEQLRVSATAASSSFGVERLQTSTLSPEVDLLNDSQVEAMYNEALRVSKAWLSRTNQDLDVTKRSTSLTLDFEFRTMASQWPARKDSAQNVSDRIVLKQVRPLEPGAREIDEVLYSEPIPRDLLINADRISRRICLGKNLDVQWLEVFTKTTARPDFGFTTEPFIAELRIGTGIDRPEFGLQRGEQWELDSRYFNNENNVRNSNGDSGFDLSVLFDESVPLTSVTVQPTVGGETSEAVARIGSSDGSTLSQPITCEDELLFASPDQFLRSLLEP